MKKLTEIINLRHETQARKPLEKERCETEFQDAKTHLHLAKVSFLIAKTATCKRSLSLTRRCSLYWRYFLAQQIFNRNKLACLSFQ